MLQEMNEIILMILTGGFAAFLIYVGYGNYRKRKACCIPVRGIFVEVRTIKRRNTIYKYGVFEYNYQGQSYRHSSIDNIAGRRGRNFHIGEAYEIYINPQNPKSLRCLKKLWTAWSNEGMRCIHPASTPAPASPRGSCWAMTM